MVGFIFNHDVFDEPYKQTASKWLDKLATYVESLNEKPFFTFGNRRGSLMGPDMDDEYIIVQHTIDLTAEQKQTLVSYIKEMVAVKKSIYKTEVPEILIVFEKKKQEDCFIF